MRGSVLILGMLLPLGAGAALRTWTGAGPDRYWATPMNWVDRVLPQPADDLVFINAGWGWRSTNNFPSNTVFGSITAEKYLYHFFGDGLYGNPITLNAGIRTTRSTTNMLTCHLDIGLNADQTFEANAALQLRGGLDLRGYTLTLAGPEEHYIYGPIVGTGGIIKTGTNIASAYGTNTYSGITHIRAGSYQVSQGWLGDTTSGTIVDADAHLSVTGRDIYEPLVLSGTLSGGDVLFRPGSPGSTWWGPIVLPAGTVGRITYGTTIAGTISGDGGVVLDRYALAAYVEALGQKAYLELTGQNTYTGPTFVRGPVRISGSQPFSPVVLASGILSGTGLVGSISATGTLAKTLAPGLGAGTLSTRGLALDGSVTLEFELDTLPAQAFDRIAVEGSVSLNHARLALKHLALPVAPGTRFTIIENDGTDAIDGTFTNLLEGMSFDSTNGARFRITYQGGDGNDVAIESVAIRQTLWDGGGADNRWSTAENWSGDVAPNPGDELYFPAGALQRTNVNDLPAGTRFHSIKIDDSYMMQGSAVVLEAGLRTDPGPVTVVLELPLRLAFPQRIRADSGRLRLVSAIDTAGNELTFEQDGGNFIEVFSEVTGPGGLRASSSEDDPVRLLLAGANTYSGPTYVFEGAVLDISNALALGSPEQGTFVAGYTWLRVRHGVSIPEPLNLQGTLEAIGPGPANWDGPITVEDAEIVASGQALQINGVISGSGFTKRGPNVLTLNADNIYTGQTIVRAGTLFVNGSQPASAVVLNYEPGSTITGTLGGVGRVGNIAVTSPYPTRIAPGVNGAGVLSAGNVALNMNTRLIIDLNGTPGNHDQLRVNGSVDLRDAEMSVALGYAPTPGDSFVIVENDGNDPITGNFLHFPEGSAFMVGATQLQITYVGGDGNDVELRVTSGLQVVRLWDGGGPNDFWTTSENWIGDIAPLPGDALAFPEGARKTSVNNFPPYTRFGRVSIGAGNYVLSGQPVMLDQGIASAFSSGLSRITFPIRLATNQTCQAANIFSLNLDGPIDTAGWTLSLDGDGSVSILGPVSGSGGLIKVGNGTVRLAGANTYSGHTEIVRGALWLDPPHALGNATGATVVQPGAMLAIEGGSNTFAEPLVWGGTLRLNNTRIGARWTGPIELTSGEARLWSVASEAFMIDGPISGPGGLLLDGGFLILNNANTYTGLTTVGSGRLRVNGHQPQSPIVGTGSLDGTGRVGHVTMQGVYSGIINPGGTNLSSAYNQQPGVLSLGGLDADQSGRLTFDVVGAAPGTGHDQIRCFGALKLAGTRLELGLSFNPAVEQSFTLIDNDGTDPVIGAFDRLPEGGYWSHYLTPAVFQITYTGGDGNDVVIKRVHPPPSTLERIVTYPNGYRIVYGRGIPYVRYILEATSTLNPIIPWTPIATNSADFWDMYSLTDLPAPNFPMRFYRVRSQ